MKRVFVILSILFISQSAIADPVDLTYYLSEGTSYNSDIPTPEAFFGFQIGQWHLRHDLTVAYMKELAKRSDRTCGGRAFRDSARMASLQITALGCPARTA